MSGCRARIQEATPYSMYQTTYALLWHLNGVHVWLCAGRNAVQEGVDGGRPDICPERRSQRGPETKCQ